VNRVKRRGIVWISVGTTAGFVRSATLTIFEDLEFVKDAFELAKGWLLE
jgi:hypothetical protein